MPCYDFAPIIDPTFYRPTTIFGCYQLSWRDGRCVQDSRTYSPWRADSRLLAIPTSWGRVADLNLNWGDFSYDWLRLAPLHRVVVAIVSRVWPRVSEGHADLASSSPSSLRQTNRVGLEIRNSNIEIRNKWSQIKKIIIFKTKMEFALSF